MSQSGNKTGLLRRQDKFHLLQTQPAEQYMPVPCFQNIRPQPLQDPVILQIAEDFILCQAEKSQCPHFLGGLPRNFRTRIPAKRPEALLAIPRNCASITAVGFLKLYSGGHLLANRSNSFIVRSPFHSAFTKSVPK